MKIMIHEDHNVEFEVFLFVIYKSYCSSIVKYFTSN